jgi:HEPN domain-containing protein
MPHFVDALAQYRAAQRALEAAEIPNAISSAQMCAESSLKALMEVCGLTYDYSHQIVHHDVQHLITRLQHASPAVTIPEWEIRIARAAAMASILGGFRQIAQYGFPGASAEATLSGDDWVQFARFAVSRSYRAYTEMKELADQRAPVTIATTPAGEVSASGGED